MISQRRNIENEKIATFIDLLSSFKNRKRNHVADLTNCRLDERKNMNYTYDSPLCSSILSIYTYTDDSGFFVQSPELGNQFSHEKFFPDLNALASGFVPVRWDNIELIDTNWKPLHDES